jgi:hypothetical protein
MEWRFLSGQWARLVIRPSMRDGHADSLRIIIMMILMVNHVLPEGIELSTQMGPHKGGCLTVSTPN